MDKIKVKLLQAFGIIQLFISDEDRSKFGDQLKLKHPMYW